MKRVGGTGGRVLKAVAAAKSTTARAQPPLAATLKIPPKFFTSTEEIFEEEDDPYAFRPADFSKPAGITAVFSRKKPAGGAGGRASNATDAEKHPPAALGANQQHATLKKRIFRRSEAPQNAVTAAQAPRPRPAALLQRPPAPAAAAEDEEDEEETEPSDAENEHPEDGPGFGDASSSASEPEIETRRGEKVKGRSAASITKPPQASPGSASDWDPIFDDSASSEEEEEPVRKAAVRKKTPASTAAAKKTQAPPTFRVSKTPAPSDAAVDIAAAPLVARTPAPKAKSARKASAAQTATLEVMLPAKLFKASADTVVLIEVPPGVGLVGAAGVVGRFTRNTGAFAGRNFSDKAAAAAAAAAAAVAAPIIELMGVMYEMEHVSLPGTAMLARAAGTEMVIEAIAQSAVRAEALPGQDSVDESVFFASDDEYGRGEDAGAGLAVQKGKRKRKLAATGIKAGGAKKAMTTPAAAKAKPAARKKKA